MSAWWAKLKEASQTPEWQRYVALVVFVAFLAGALIAGAYSEQLPYLDADLATTPEGLISQTLYLELTVVVVAVFLGLVFGPWIGRCRLPFVGGTSSLIRTRR